MRLYRTKLQEKLEESLKAVLPVAGIVLLLSFTIAPVPAGILLEFLAGAALLLIGMMFFTLGAELAMTPMGERTGGSMANQVPSIPNPVLILAVAGGVAAFLVLALLRMLFKVPLSPVLIVFYLIVMAAALFVPADFLAVAFDSGGVTTGPMTVPFIMAFGVGIASVRSDERAAEDSFGLVALCSIGPILAVLLLGILYNPDGGNYAGSELVTAADSVERRPSPDTWERSCCPCCRFCCFSLPFSSFS